MEIEIRYQFIEDLSMKKERPIYKDGEIYLIRSFLFIGTRKTRNAEMIERIPITKNELIDPI